MFKVSKYINWEKEKNNKKRFNNYKIEEYLFGIVSGAAIYCTEWKLLKSS